MAREELKYDTEQPSFVVFNECYSRPESREILLLPEALSNDSIDPLNYMFLGFGPCDHMPEG